MIDACQTKSGVKWYAIVNENASNNSKPHLVLKIWNYGNSYATVS